MQFNALFLLIALGSSLAFAAEPPSPTLGTNNKAPTYVKSDTLSLDSKNRTFVYTGNVEAKNGDLTVISDVLDGTYDENDKIKELIAHSNVLITKGDKIRANSQRAVFNNASQTVVLTENPELLQNESVLSADKITIFLKDDHSQAEGNVRVKLAKKEESKDDSALTILKRKK